METGELGRTAAVIGHLAAGHNVDEEEGLDAAGAPLISSDTIAADYPLFASSLFNLLKNAETRLKK